MTHFFLTELYVARHTYVYSPFSAPLGCGSWGPVARGRSWCDFLVCRRRRQLRGCGWWGCRLDDGSEGGGFGFGFGSRLVESRVVKMISSQYQFMSLTSSPAAWCRVMDVPRQCELHKEPWLSTVDKIR